MADYDAKIRVGTDVDTSKMQKLQIQINKATEKVVALSDKLEELKNKEVPTEDYQAISSQIAKAEVRLESLIKKQDRMSDLGKNSGSAWDALQYDIEEVKNTISYAKSELQELVDTGKAFTIGGNSEEITDATNKLAMARAELRALTTRQQELLGKQSEGATGFKKLAQSAKKCFKEIWGGTKKSNGLLSTLGTRLKGIALSLLVFNWITKGFNAMVQAMKEGFQNLAQYSDDYNTSMSDLKSQMAQLKNSLAAAFEPIVNAVIPYITQLVSWLNTATDAMAQFLAALQGKSTYTRAKEQVIDYAKSLDTASKSAKRALASFDELNVLNKNESSTNAGGETTGAEAFETADVETQIASFVERIQTAMQPFKDSLRNWFSEIDFAPLLESLGNLKTACEPLVNDISDGLLWVLENVLEPLGSWTIEEALPEIIDMLTESFKALDDTLTTLQPTLDYIWNNILVPIGEFTGGVFLEAIRMIKDAFSSLSKLFTEKGDEINSILMTVGRAFEFLWEFVAKPTIQFLIGGLKTFLKYIVNIVGDVIDILAGIIDFITGIFTGDWEKAWNGLANIFKGIINLIIDIFEGVVNTIIDGLNYISIDVPEWVPEIGGEKFGFDLARLELPRLAEGAVIQGGKPFAAILGDQKFGQTNIETPLHTMVDAFKQAMAENGGGAGGEYTFVAQLDSKTIFKETVKQNQLYQKATGRSAFGY